MDNSKVIATLGTMKLIDDGNDLGHVVDGDRVYDSHKIISILSKGDWELVEETSTKSLETFDDELKMLSWRPWSKFEKMLIAAITSALENQLEFLSKLLLKSQDHRDLDSSGTHAAINNILADSVGEIINQLTAYGVKKVRDIPAASGAGVSVNWDLANERAALRARTHVGQMIKKINSTTRDAVQKSVTDWMNRGGSIDDLIKDLRSIKLENGQSAFGPKRARLIAITESTIAYANANTEAWVALGYRPAVFKPGQSHPGCRCYLQPKTLADGTKVLTWFTVRDERVCVAPTETPWGSVLGCKELHGIIVSEGIHMGKPSNG